MFVMSLESVADFFEGLGSWVVEDLLFRVAELSIGVLADTLVQMLELMAGYIVRVVGYCDCSLFCWPVTIRLGELHHWSSVEAFKIRSGSLCYGGVDGWDLKDGKSAVLLMKCVMRNILLLLFGCWVIMLLLPEWVLSWLTIAAMWFNFVYFGFCCYWYRYYCCGIEGFLSNILAFITALNGHSFCND